MTPKEHQLVITMLMRQSEAIRVLGNVLKSREIIQGDDLAAFEAALHYDAPANVVELQKVAEQYQVVAKALGLDILPASS
jgi:hypothetical protein